MFDSDNASDSDWPSRGIPDPGARGSETAVELGTLDLALFSSWQEEPWKPMPSSQQQIRVLSTKIKYKSSLCKAQITCAN